MKTFFHWLGKGGHKPPLPTVQSHASVTANNCRNIAEQIEDNDTHCRFPDVAALLRTAGLELDRLTEQLEARALRDEGDIVG